MVSCYWYNNQGSHLHSAGVPCTSTANGAIAMCCDPGEICLSNGMCQFSHSDPGGSGYYSGGCTDPGFNDPVCPRNCTTFGNTDLVYNYSNEYWQCCGSLNGERNCSIPQGSPLSGGAPPPMNLSFIAKIDGSSTAIPLQPTPVPLNTAANGASPTAMSSAASTDASSGGLSFGAGIGIGLVVGLVVAALVWLLAWRVWRYRGYRLVNTTQNMHNHGNHDPFSGFGQEIGSAYTSQRQQAAEIPEHAKAEAEIHDTSKVEIQDTSRSFQRAEVPG